MPMCMQYERCPHTSQTAKERHINAIPNEVKPHILRTAMAIAFTPLTLMLSPVRSEGIQHSPGLCAFLWEDCIALDVDKKTFILQNLLLRSIHRR